MPNDEERDELFAQNPPWGLRPAYLQSYQDALRELLADDDHYARSSRIDTRGGGQRWWAEYGLIMILVMMATLVWALVDRDTSSSTSGHQYEKCAPDYSGGC
ncbi:MAG: hypothetical protein M3N28_07490 [Actinomycetota bacterium]|nr:hypothetical protein [Actinomycetota bacterium]